MPSTADAPRNLGDHSQAAEARLRRARGRLNRVYLTVFASLFARAGSIAVLLVTVPIALHELDHERFGIWMVLSSFGALLAFADFGIGNGLISRIADATGREEFAEITMLTTAGTALLVCLGVAVAVIGTICSQFVDWSSLLGIAPALEGEARNAMLAFFLCFALAVPAGLSSKVMLGLQRGHEVSYWLGAGNLAALAATVIALRGGAALPWVVMALFGIPQLFLVASNLVFFGWQDRKYAPNPRHLQPRLMLSILASGAAFFVLQIVALLVFRIDALVVSHFYGAPAAGTFAISERLFSLISMICALAFAPLWPVYAEAAARGDHRFVRALLRNTMSLALLGSLAAGLFVALSYGWITRLWLGREVPVTTWLLAGFVALRSLEGVGFAFAMYLNGMGFVRLQAGLAVILAFVTVGAKVLLGAHLPIAALVWITAVAYLAVTLVPLGIATVRSLAMGERRERQ